MKVTFTHSSGRTQQMNENFAKVLANLGRGTYVTRDMRAQPLQQAVPQPVYQESAKEEQEEGDGLDSLTLDELHDLAKERGVRVHHKAGVERVLAALRESKED